uniref:Uncharacterized protein n=1 Tax=Tanacetum cinerariifolium TaxID=118510 RepID=A0A699QG77_TANCI|nr:hypothetical protein [Tanacetum cinerariifolium]
MNAQELAERLMGLFRSKGLKPTHMLDMRQMNSSLLSKLNPKERDLLATAIENLVDRQFVEVSEWMNQTSLVLTQAGYDYAYPLDEEETITRIGQSILRQFEKAQARAGHGLPLRMLDGNLFDKLNPKERGLVPTAIQRLVEEGLMIEREGSLSVLVLTEAGYDKLY